MSELILFRPRPGRTQQRGSPALTGAQIMFFTGVRYERMIEPPPTREDESIDPAPAEGYGERKARASSTAQLVHHAIVPQTALPSARRFAYALQRDTSPQREAPI